MLQQSIRKTYPVSRSKRNFDSRKARAIAKAKIQKTFTDNTKTVSHRRKPYVESGCQKTATGCIMSFNCFGLAGLIFVFAFSFEVFESIWSNVLIASIGFVLSLVLSVAAFFMEGHGYKTGILPSNVSKEAGCFVCGIFLIYISVFLGCFSIIFVYHPDSYGFEKGLAVGGFVCLLIGIGIIPFIWKRGKKDSGKDDS